MKENQRKELSKFLKEQVINLLTKLDEYALEHNILKSNIKNDIPVLSNNISKSIIKLLDKYYDEVIIRNKSIEWTQEEIEKLKNVYGKYPNKKLLDIFPNRTLTNIRSKARKLKLCKEKEIWTNSEIELLKEIYSYSSDEELMNKFPSRKLETIRVKASSLNLRKIRKWTEKETELLKEIYPKMKINELLNYFPDKSKKSIQHKAEKLKLKKLKL